MNGENCDLIATGPLDAFTLRIQMSVYVGIALAMPVLLWQLWRFITLASTRRRSVRASCSRR
jgi:sec-independent protein translocase protein TatC